MHVVIYCVWLERKDRDFKDNFLLFDMFSFLWNIVVFSADVHLMWLSMVVMQKDWLGLS